ncbi:porin [Echinimonas agarilytica]|uniref:Porin domain-containing protein n=1 Tax=Echinimonas agarilytica TaxID=1215918 RepID=A0AA41W4L0_9GAMM|nr:porin [Echinimonas agarilytica]MCM2678844.1 hypothetical protein [Echinimonas agarilytica]
MKTRVHAIALGVAAAVLGTSAFAADSDEERIKKLEQQVTVLQAQQKSADPLDRFHINGFASVGMGIASEDLGYAGYKDDDVHFSPDSMAALQVSFDINSKAQAVVQIVARGEDDWDPEFEWAYVSYQFDNGVTARGGRLRAPVFMLSDYLEVGYAYSFARPSVEVYESLPISTLDGFDLRIPVALGDTTLTFQPFVGETTIEADNLENDTDVDNILGLAVELDWSDFNFRTSYATSELKEESESSIVDGADGTFLGFGAGWDNGDWVVMGEWTRIEVDGLYPDTDSYYVSAGYRYNDLTPYVMVSGLESQDDDERAIPIPGIRSSADIERMSYSLGLRWDFAAGMAVKFDATLVDDFGDTSGGFPANSVALPVGGGSTIPVVAPDAIKIDDVALYSVVFDVIF